MTKVPQIIAFHDLSGLGRCSLALVLPVSAHYGIHALPLTSALLSSSTEYRDFVCHHDDLFIRRVLEHWKKENIHVDAFYSGYLASQEQQRIAEETIEMFKPPLVLIDPVFADEGKLYPSFTKDHIKGYQQLITKAHIITPNISEALLITGRAAFSTPSLDEIQDIARELAHMGPDLVCITSVTFAENEMGIILYEKSTRSFKAYKHPCHSEHYSGSGDFFATAFLAELLDGNSPQKALKSSLETIYQCLCYTIDSGSLPREGLIFEAIFHKPHLKKEERQKVIEHLFVLQTTSLKP